MKRFITTLVLALATTATTAVVSTTPAHAQPSDADMAKAKKAFTEGKAAHEAKKFDEAIEKYKLAYNLSKKPVMLYNVALAMADAGGMEDLAIFNIRKYLKEAPADDASRPAAETKLKELETKLNGGTPPKPPTDPKPPGTDPKPPGTDPKPPVAIKPAGTYTEADFQHMVVDTAPPKKPLDVTASVPEDSGWVVTLYYRTAGEGKFASKVMKWRYKELVARIPATKMLGSAVQYYIEAKDSAGQPVGKSAKSTSPNQVLLEDGAPARFYPDMSDEGDAKVAPKDVVKSDDDDDPLHKGKKKDTAGVVIEPTGPAVPGNGLTDVGSSKFSKVKWGTTIGGASLLAFAAVSFVQAKKYSSALEDDSNECGAPPCRAFSTPDDSYAKDVEASGKSWNTYFKVGLGVGVGVSAVAAYFWIKEMKAKKRGEVKVSTGGKAPETTWLVVPAIGEHTAGAAATVRF